MNLLEGTKRVLEKEGKSLSDIEWVGCYDFEVPIDNFLEVAKKTNYYNGYGTQEVAKDLIIVGDNFYLERHEYDGSEWWEFKSIPSKPDISKNIKRLARTNDMTGWKSLEEINDDIQGG